jgi:hypothetical protein
MPLGTAEPPRNLRRYMGPQGPGRVVPISLVKGPGDLQRLLSPRRSLEALRISREEDRKTLGDPRGLRSHLISLTGNYWSLKPIWGLKKAVASEGLQGSVGPGGTRGPTGYYMIFRQSSRDLQGELQGL